MLESALAFFCLGNLDVDNLLIARGEVIHIIHWNNLPLAYAHFIYRIMDRLPTCLCTTVF